MRLVEARRGQWRFALFFALLLHAAQALWAFPGKGPLLVAPLFAKAELSIDIDSFEPSNSIAPGGGTLEAGKAVDGIPKPAREMAPRLGALLPKRAFDSPPLAKTNSQAEPELPGDALEYEAIADALENAFDLIEPSLKVRGLPAHRTLLSARAGKPPSRTSGTPQAGRDFGLGGGRNGGPGGNGRGSGSSVFGGTSGAFQADVCFIDPGLESLRQFPPCRRALSLRTTTINVPAQRFTKGFPGIPDRSEWFSIRYTGPFSVRRAGVYVFRVVSDDGAMLFVDGELIIDNDGRHAPRSVSGAVSLEAGEHDFELDYYQGPREMIALQLFVTTPGRRERLFKPRL